MVHWYWSLWLGNLYLQYQILTISIDFQFLFNFVFYFKNNKNKEINKKITFLLYLTYSSIILGDLHMLVGLLGGQIHLLGVFGSSLHARELQKKYALFCFYFFNTQGCMRVPICYHA